MTTTLRTSLRFLLAAAAASVVASPAQARPYDAKALAHYDRSYVECESSNPAMKGRRDEAYLNLWGVKPDDKAIARLAKLRADPAYAAEQKRVAKAPVGASTPASSVVQRQCRGLWTEHQRVSENAKRP